MKRWPWTDDNVRELADAMDQLLDDMGEKGQSVCLYAKAKARIAFEPFRDPEDHTDDFTLAQAKQIVSDEQRQVVAQSRLARAALKEEGLELVEEGLERVGRR